MNKRVLGVGVAILAAGFAVAVLGASGERFGLMLAGVTLVLPGAFILWRFYTSLVSEE